MPIDFYRLGFDSLSLAERKALVAKHGLGAQSKYGDTFFTKAAEEPRAIGLAFAKWLVTQGQRVDAKSARGTALHVAVRMGNLRMVDWLIASSANVSVRSAGETPLDAMLAEASNVDLERIVPMLRALLAAGARVSPAAKRSAQRAYAGMDYHRDGMAPAFRRRCEAAARAICEVVGVEPPPPRSMHDGKSPIAVAKASLAKQFAGLWRSLVPSRGTAATLQGEVVRIAGRINDELSRNGGVNWDADYQEMARAFARHVQGGEALAGGQLAAVEALTASLSKRKRPPEDDARLLRAAAVAWVARNPRPVKLGKVRYRR